MIRQLLVDVLIAVPTGFTPEGLPLGVQLVGRPADELTLISLAQQIENAQLWKNERPAIAEYPDSKAN